ncbi:TPA: hypothetical protein HA318_01165 [Candidatus Micrarchaeota archaeon]|nr:hypothetical protein [Candidatus Micrarchaeota archaeon]
MVTSVKPTVESDAARPFDSEAIVLQDGAEKTANSGTEGGAAGRVKRSGRTREHYIQQKNQCFVYFRLNKGDFVKIESAQFTLYDFINNSFAFSSTKKQLTVAVLDALKGQPLSFNELVVKLNAKKSTLYLLCLALQNSGLISLEGGKGGKYVLSGDFGKVLKKHSDWWQAWMGR